MNFSRRNTTGGDSIYPTSIPVQTIPATAIRGQRLVLSGAKMSQRQAGQSGRWSFSIGALALVTLASGVGAFLALALAAAPDGRASPPHVVSSYPATNSQIEPGKLTLRVTFDRPMSPGSYSFIERDPESFPTCVKPATQSADGRTFILECLTEAHRGYDVGFNDASHHNFTGANDGAPATPSVIHFSTR